MCRNVSTCLINIYMRFKNTKLFNKSQNPKRSHRKNARERRGDETSRFLISYRSFCEQKHVARPWYDDFCAPKRTKWPVTSPRSSKWRRCKLDDSITLQRWQSLPLNRFFSRVSNAPLKVWRVTWHRRHTVVAFLKLVKRSLENIIVAAPLLPLTSRGLAIEHETRQNPPMMLFSFEWTDLSLSGLDKIRAFFLPSREFHFGMWLDISTFKISIWKWWKLKNLYGHSCFLLLLLNHFSILVF